MSEHTIPQMSTSRAPVYKPSPVVKLRKFGNLLFFVGPSMSVIFLVLIFPTIGAIYLSLQDFVKQKLTYVGFQNYPDAISDPKFWNSLLINVKFTAFSVIFSLIMGLLLALLLSNIKKGRRFFRTAFMLPWPILSVVAGIIFSWMFNAQYGVINEILVQVGILDAYRSWLGEANTALPIVLFASVWKESPFFMIMIMAALQAIPHEQYEAAAVDGANGWQQFIHITLPNLRQIIMISTMLQIIWRFREFDLVSVMTQGGPNGATEVLAVLVYRYAFDYFRFGKGAAIAVVMSLISLVFTLIYLKLLHKKQAETS